MRVVRLGRDRAVLGAAGAVAALGLQRAEIGLAERLLRPEAVAMRDLVEAVLHRLRPELDRLEEDVVFRVARHRAKPPLEDGNHRDSPTTTLWLQAAGGRREGAGGRPHSGMSQTGTAGASGAGTSSGSCGVSSRQCGVS